MKNVNFQTVPMVELHWIFRIFVIISSENQEYDLFLNNPPDILLNGL